MATKSYPIYLSSFEKKSYLSVYILQNLYLFIIKINYTNTIHFVKKCTRKENINDDYDYVHMINFYSRLLPTKKSHAENSNPTNFQIQKIKNHRHYTTFSWLIRCSNLKCK